MSGLPAVKAQGLTGLMDLALHPRFAENSLVYFTYNKPASSDNGAQTGGGLTLARGRWTGTEITNFQELFSAGPNNNASRISFGRDDMSYMTAGVADPPQAARAQDPNDLAGKVRRLRDDGTVPPDIPFVNRAGYRPEIYTMGHPTALGLTLQPDTGGASMFTSSPPLGPSSHSQMAGKNYGWPKVSNGRFYAGPRVSVNPYKERHGALP